ncbi:hypothetical protein O0544_20610 [Edwardsiella anguillarum]|nr:hypothetical protein [Edwardsiella anguillarum]
MLAPDPGGARDHPGANPGAFAAVAQRHPLGFDLLLARYREDRQAEQRAAGGG